MPWWKALLWLSTQQGSACGYNNTAPLSSVYLEETNSKWKKGRANHLPLRFDTHFSLTQAIFISVQARPSEDLWVSSCNHSSRLQQFQRPGSLPANCPPASPLCLARAHSNTNRLENNKHGLNPDRSGSSSHSEVLLATTIHGFYQGLQLPERFPQHFPTLALLKAEHAKPLQLMHLLSTEHYHSILIKIPLQEALQSVTASARERNCTISIQVHTAEFCQYRLTFRCKIPQTTSKSKTMINLSL